MMGTVAAVGKSTKHPPFEAGREATHQAIAGIGRRPDLLLVFGTAGYDQPALLGGVTQECGDAPLCGCSGEGVISQQGSDESTRAVAVMAIASDCATFDTFLLSDLSRGPAARGEALAAELRRRTDRQGRCLLLFPDGISGNCSAFLSALDKGLPYPLVIAGGLAGDLAQLKTTYQYYDGRAVTDSVAAVLIGGDVTVESTDSHGCTPIGSLRTVTKSDGATVAEIDGKSAWSVFKEYVDSDATDLVAADAVYLSFGERLPAEAAARYGQYVMRTPFALDKQSGTLFFPGGLAEGARIQMTRRDPDRIRDSATESAKELAARQQGKRPSLVLQFECAGRGRIIFGEHATETVVTPIQDVLGHDLPWLGFHTYGEIAQLGGKPYYHNYTVVLCALYDAERGAAPDKAGHGRSGAVS